MAIVDKISPTFTGDNAKRIMQYVALVRDETKLPELSVSQALMRLVNKELGDTDIQA